VEDILRASAAYYGGMQSHRGQRHQSPRVTAKSSSGRLPCYSSILRDWLVSTYRTLLLLSHTAWRLGPERTTSRGVQSRLIRGMQAQIARKNRPPSHLSMPIAFSRISLCLAPLPPRLASI
jgi:hypothetical protein